MEGIYMFMELTGLSLMVFDRLSLVVALLLFLVVTSHFEDEDSPIHT